MRFISFLPPAETKNFYIDFLQDVVVFLISISEFYYRIKGRQNSAYRRKGTSLQHLNSRPMNNQDHYELVL